MKEKKVAGRSRTKLLFLAVYGKPTAEHTKEEIGVGQKMIEDMGSRICLKKDRNSRTRNNERVHRPHTCARRQKKLLPITRAPLQKVSFEFYQHNHK